MERSKSIISIVVGLAAILIIWRVGFYPPAPEQTETPVVTEVAAEPNVPGEANEPMVTFDVDEPRGRRPAGDDEPVRMFAESEPNEPAEPNGPMEFVNLKSVEMKSIIEKLASWTGKVIIPTDEALKQKVTIYAPEKLPRSEALRVIYSALRLKGYIVEESDGTIFLKPIADAKLGRVPTIAANEPLAMIENKDQIVLKFFELSSYSPSEMGTIIQPLVGEHGYVSVDETGGTLMVIDTVSNLMRLQHIIQQFDVPGSELAVTDIIEVRFGDPSEIVQMLNILLGEMEGRSTLQYNRYRDQRDRRAGRSVSSRNSTAQRTSGSAAKKTDSSQGSATSVVVGTTRGPVVLIPEPRRKWIIAKASAEDLKQIKEWVNKLDMEEPVGSEYEVVQLRYADPREVEDSVGDGFRDLPGTEFLPSILVQPLTQTKQVIVFGRKDLREIVKKMIAEIDVPPGQFETAHIKLKHADPDMVKEKLDELYQDGMSGSSRLFGGYNPYSRGRGSSSQSSEMVKVVSYTTLKEITVVASPENMIEIRKRIDEWDVPLDVDSVKPRIIELHNCDPVEMANLLTSLFSEGGGSSSSRGVAMFRGMFATQLVDQQKIVGALYGQLAFEEVPGTKKIIVISKIPEAYDVIEELVKELDKAEMAEIPKVIELKYSDPEVLCEILNAMFAEAGTSASLRRTDVGLSEYSMSEDTATTASTDSTSQGQYTPPWSSSGARRTVDEEMPISNVIGRIRFVPETRTKSLLVLSPPEFMPEIVKLIEQLDVPGKQVMIKAIIVEVDHSNMTSLGIQLAPTGSEGLAFGNYDEDTIAIVNNLSYMETHGTFTFQTAADVTAMIDFLTTQTNAKILNQQTLWTEDNEEASFFKGERVAFFTATTTTTTVGVTQNVEFSQVGMTLAVRPSITPNKDVDMIINILISQIIPGEEANGQPVRTEMETKTNMIVGDGQTIMLGGILFQEDRIVKRKVPLLGDIPLIGELLFGHTETVAANNEMLVFITPYVIDDFDNLAPETREQIEQPKEKLETIREQLDASIGQLK